MEEKTGYTVQKWREELLEIRETLSEKIPVYQNEDGEVIMGQVLTAGAGQMPARQSAVAGGIPWVLGPAAGAPASPDTSDRPCRSR